MNTGIDKWTKAASSETLEDDAGSAVEVGEERLHKDLDKWTNADFGCAWSQTPQDNDASEYSDATAADAGKDKPCKELVLRVVRDVGVGLGMSIAGGAGTTAFKGGDKVCIPVINRQRSSLCCSS